VEASGVGRKKEDEGRVVVMVKGDGITVMHVLSLGTHPCYKIAHGQLQVWLIG
jgi:thiamine pyrophosphate-dependent acetolactate synthase large subunit-like protein